MIGQILGHYRIERRLGEGGMGVVYAARDEKLQRPVALKVIRGGLGDASLRERFWREARAAAAFNHPNICHLYEIGEQQGELFITMELLEGETLAERVARGALPLVEAIHIGLEILDALGALHRRGFVHRDIKPSNVFVTHDGRVKLLDFGLVFPVAAGPAPTGAALTMTGMVMGSPRYMAPEQIRGTPLDGRADLFSLGVVIHEAITGRTVFKGEHPVEAMHSVLNDHPSNLGGSGALEAVGRVLTHALEKRPEQRPASAEEMAAALRAVDIAGDTSRAQAVERLVRLAVLPFRMLRADPELDFLGPSLADAIAMSLAGIRSLIVRSTVATAGFGGPTPDLKEIATTLDVDVVLVGTVLPAGERCRVAAQLVEVPQGNVIWSETSDATGRDVFQIQDQLMRRIVDSLQLPLSSRERGALGRDVPASPTAYEFFLRANRMATISSDLTVARDLYLRAVEADPLYAPAWVQLGRCYRLMGKYFFTWGHEENLRLADQALARALELRPDLPAAQHVKAHRELDLGQAEQAIDRLLGVVKRNPNDPQGYSGLVAAFRYLGLIEESLAAHRRARALDPHVVTSVMHSFETLGEHEKALAEPSSQFAFDRARTLALLGHDQEALDIVREFELRERSTPFFFWCTTLRAAIERNATAAVAEFEALMDFPDPEGLCVIARCRARSGDLDGAVRMVERSVETGYANVTILARDPWLEPIRQDERFVAAVRRATERHRAAAATYGAFPTTTPSGSSTSS